MKGTTINCVRLGCESECPCDTFGGVSDDANRCVRAPQTERVGPDQSLGQIVTTLDTCAMFVRLRRPAIEHLLDDEMRRAILRGLAVDTTEFLETAFAPALTPVFEAALDFLRAHEACSALLDVARGVAVEQVQ